MLSRAENALGDSESASLGAIDSTLQATIRTLANSRPGNPRAPRSRDTSGPATGPHPRADVPHRPGDCPTTTLLTTVTGRECGMPVQPTPPPRTWTARCTAHLLRPSSAYSCTEPRRSTLDTGAGAAQ